LDNIGKLFSSIANKYPDKEVLFYKHEGKYHGIKFKEFLEQVKCFAIGLEAIGFKQGDRLALLSENRPQWLICDLATIGIGGIDVPLYTSITPSQIEYTMNNSGAKILVVSSEALLKKVLAVRNKLHFMDKIILLDNMESENKTRDIITYQEILETGMEKLATGTKDYEEKIRRVKPSDLATIMYTSGTTGVPKGVMLSHNNIIAEIQALGKSIEVEGDDILISFLPLSHVLGRLVEYFIVFNGCAIGYAESLESLPRNLMELKPTLFISVPRVYEKIYSMIFESLRRGSPFRKKLFDWALKSRKCYMDSDGLKHKGFQKLKYLIAEKFILSKVKERLGGRLRILISGGAPLLKEVGEFFRDLGLIIQEGYGLTETTCAVTLNRRDNIRYGTVGQPLPGIEIAIGENSEILVRGPVVMQGYYKDDEGTRRVIDKDGWLHTGDAGFLDSDNFLTITDRLKDLIKTSSGKYVAPQQIENAYKANKFIAQAVVIGENKKFITALLIPDFEMLKKYAAEEGITFSKNEDLINNPKISLLFRSVTDEINKNLADFEKIRKFALITDNFSIEAEELTPTLKVKRNIILEKYRDVINKMYGEQ